MLFRTLEEMTASFLKTWAKGVKELWSMIESLFPKIQQRETCS